MVEKTALEQRGSTSFWSPEPVLIFAGTASYKVKQPRCTRFFADLRLKIEAVYERHFKSFHMEATPLKTAKWTHLNRAVSLSWNVSISIRWKPRQNPTPICTAKGVLGELDIGRKQNGRYPHNATVGPLPIRTSIWVHLAKSDCPDQFLTSSLNNAVIFGLTSVYVTVLLNEKLGYFVRDRSWFVILFKLLLGVTYTCVIRPTVRSRWLQINPVIYLPLLFSTFLWTKTNLSPNKKRQKERGQHPSCFKKLRQ